MSSNTEDLRELVLCQSCDGDGKEHCSNPDHNFVAGAGTEEMQRLGCPTCDFPRSTVVIKGGICEACNGKGIPPNLTADLLFEAIQAYEPTLKAEYEEKVRQAQLEAKIEVADKYLAYRAASDTEADAIVWLDHNRTELKNDLIELNAPKNGEPS